MIKRQKSTESIILKLKDDIYKLEMRLGEKTDEYNIRDSQNNQLNIDAINLKQKNSYLKEKLNFLNIKMMEDKSKYELALEEMEVKLVTAKSESSLKIRYSYEFDQYSSPLKALSTQNFNEEGECLDSIKFVDNLSSDYTNFESNSDSKHRYPYLYELCGEDQASYIINISSHDILDIITQYEHLVSQKVAYSSIFEKEKKQGRKIVKKLLNEITDKNKEIDVLVKQIHFFKHKEIQRKNEEINIHESKKTKQSSFGTFMNSFENLYSLNKNN